PGGIEHAARDQPGRHQPRAAQQQLPAPTHSVPAHLAPAHSVPARARLAVLPDLRPIPAGGVLILLCLARFSHADVPYSSTRQAGGAPPPLRARLPPLRCAPDDARNRPPPLRARPAQWPAARLPRTGTCCPQGSTYSPSPAAPRGHPVLSERGNRQ